MQNRVSARLGGEARPVRSNVVWRRISERIEHRLAVVERSIAALLGGTLSPSDAATCRAEASLLSDWLFALDQVVAGRLARDIVEHFDGTPTRESAATIAADVERLRTIIRVVEGEWANVTPGETRVHFVSGANAQIDAVAWHLQQNGIDISYSPTFFSTPDNADLIVVMSEHPSDALQLLRTVGERSPSIKRALVHSSGAKQDELLRVAPAVDLLLRYDASPLEVANQILIMLRPLQKSWAQAVLYGANSLYPELTRSGFSGLIAQDAAAVVRTVESGSQVVVIGPEASRRAELVRLLRCSPSTRSALIVVTYEDDAERDRCRRAGADLTIPNETADQVWASQLRALTVARDQSSGVVGDESAPLPTGHRAWVVLERAIAEIHRGRGSASLATISFSDGPDRLPTIHAILAEEFRRDDTVAAIGEGSVGVLLRGASLDEAAERVQRAIDKLDISTRPGMAGVAAFPEDGLGVKALVDVSITAAGRAAVHDGPIVARSDWFPGMQQALDVFIVESEPTLGGLLERLVSKVGYSTTVVGTGSAALTKLTGPAAIAPPRLILLELDAMGADGMMILRSLARAGILDHSQVIVTCSLVNDGQLREAFELGATDVITKPFSSVVLRNRIERALNP